MDKVPMIEVFAIQDVKAGCFSPPFFARNSMVACRMVGDSMSGDSQLGKHPGDYRLFRIGHWDEVSGVLLGESLPQHIADVSQFDPCKE